MTQTFSPKTFTPLTAMNNFPDQSGIKFILIPLMWYLALAVVTSTKAGAERRGRARLWFESRAQPWFHLNSELNGGTFGPLEMLENMNWHTTTPASSNNILCFIQSRFVENYFLRAPPALWRMMEQINLSLANKNKLNYFSGWSF